MRCVVRIGSEIRRTSSAHSSLNPPGGADGLGSGNETGSEFYAPTSQGNDANVAEQTHGHALHQKVSSLNRSPNYVSIYLFIYFYTWVCIHKSLTDHSVLYISRRQLFFCETLSLYFLTLKASFSRHEYCIGSEHARGSRP